MSHDILTARIATLSTAEIESAVRDLYATETRDEASRLVAANLADALAARWELTEDELDAVYLDEAFSGTYYDALLAAKAARS